jgi:hypothetical protein
MDELRKRMGKRYAFPNRMVEGSAEEGWEMADSTAEAAGVRAAWRP